MNARAINSAAGVVLAAMKQRQTAAGIAAALDAAGLLMSPETAAEIAKQSPWQRATDGLNALVDAGVGFHFEPDGHISNPAGGEHIEWDHGRERFVLTAESGLDAEAGERP